MAIELGTTTSEMLATHALNGSQRQADGAANVAESMRLQHLRTLNIADAIAAQTVRTSGVASEVLQIRGTADQPQAKPA